MKYRLFYMNCCEKRMGKSLAGKIFSRIIINNEIIGKIICVNEKAGIPDVYVGMSFYHS